MLPVNLILLTATATAIVAVGAPTSAQQSRPDAHAVRTHSIRMGEYFYRPKTITIAAGDRVRFRNTGKIAHTVADATRRGRIRSRIVKPRPLDSGASQTVRFMRRGTVHYVCTFHPGLMRGAVVVR